MAVYVVLCVLEQNKSGQAHNQCDACPFKSCYESLGVTGNKYQNAFS